MIQIQCDPGAANPGAECDGLVPTSLPLNGRSDLQAQCLVRYFNIHPALAPTMAALVWNGGRA